jgi:MFS family permease
MMGVGEGVTYPSIQNLARKWVPEAKRSRVLAFIYSGGYLAGGGWLVVAGWLAQADDCLPCSFAVLPGRTGGCFSSVACPPACPPVLSAHPLPCLSPSPPLSCSPALPPAGHQLGTIGSYLLCPLLISELGWESVFWVFGSLGFVWLLGWVPLVKDNPPPAAMSSASSGGAGASLPAPAAEGAAAQPAQQLRLQDVPWARFARSRAFWAIVAAQCTVSVGNVLAFR